MDDSVVGTVFFKAFDARRLCKILRERVTIDEKEDLHQRSHILRHKLWTDHCERDHVKVALLGPSSLTVSILVG